MKYELNDQDLVNIDFAQKWIGKLEKAGGKDWEQVKGPIKWVGEKGFNTCVAHLSKEKGIDDAKALCGALKREARKRGQLAKEHMGRLERKTLEKGRGPDKQPRKRKHIYSRESMSVALANKLRSANSQEERDLIVDNYNKTIKELKESKQLK